MASHGSACFSRAPHVRHRWIQCVCVTAFNPRVCLAGSFQNFSKLAPNRNIYGVSLLRPHVPMMKRGQSHPGSVPRGVPCGFKKCLNRGENIRQVRMISGTSDLTRRSVGPGMFESRCVRCQLNTSASRGPKSSQDFRTEICMTRSFSHLQADIAATLPPGAPRQSPACWAVPLAPGDKRPRCEGGAEGAGLRLAGLRQNLARSLGLPPAVLVGPPRGRGLALALAFAPPACGIHEAFTERTSERVCVGTRTAFRD